MYVCVCVCVYVWIKQVDVQSSHSSQNTKYPDWVSSLFSSVPPTKHRGSILT